MSSYLVVDISKMKSSDIKQVKFLVHDFYVHALICKLYKSNMYLFQARASYYISIIRLLSSVKTVFAPDNTEFLTYFKAVYFAHNQSRLFNVVNVLEIF